MYKAIMAATLVCAATTADAQMSVEQNEVVCMEQEILLTGLKRTHQIITAGKSVEGDTEYIAVYGDPKTGRVVVIKGDVKKPTACIMAIFDSVDPKTLPEPEEQKEDKKDFVPGNRDA